MTMLKRKFFLNISRQNRLNGIAFINNWGYSAIFHNISSNAQYFFNMNKTICNLVCIICRYRMRRVSTGHRIICFRKPQSVRTG